MSFTENTKLLFRRQYILLRRDTAILYGKMVEALVVGVLLGIVYLNSDTSLYLRMLFFSIAIFQRQAWQRITISFALRNVFYKQRSRNFFRTSSYVIAEAIVQIPMNLVVSLIMGTIFYFMSGMTPATNTFFTFLSVLVVFQHTIGAYFTLLSSLCPNITMAQAAAGASVAFFLLFSGNIILPGLIPIYWRWMYWFNPLAWTLRSVMINEFHSGRYSPDEITLWLVKRFQITQGPEHIWIGILVLFGYYIAFTAMNAVAMHYVRFESFKGAMNHHQRKHPSIVHNKNYSSNDKADQYIHHNSSSSPGTSACPQTVLQVDSLTTTVATTVAVAVVDTPTTAPCDSSKTSSIIKAHAVPSPPMIMVDQEGLHSSQHHHHHHNNNNNVNSHNNHELKFNPAYLTVRDLDYYVTLPTGEEKQLLDHITAYFEPCTMTALMGSSGAGKTTFMDVIAGRKTGGRVLGDICINGEAKDPATFSRITAYCEQMDIHSERATIREALEFSTYLRLPQHISDRAKQGLIEQTLELLELDVIANEMIANCSIEQKKRVTIGVEVVSNPSILFLDEPTSGLDARSAQIVMRGVQSIARTGRTVVCTIHQPSIQIFELFDALLLLQKGGRAAYFGTLGHDSIHLLEYFQSIPGTEKIKPLYNPATYMLEVIGAGIGRKDIKNYADEYQASALCRTNYKETTRLSVHSSDMIRFSTLRFAPYATSFSNQFYWLAMKACKTYWRSPSYNFVRLISFPIFALIFGSTFYQLKLETTAQVNSHVALIYNSLDFIGVINMMTVLDMTCSERAVFYRERMSNYYNVLPYSLSLFVAEFPYLIIVSLSFISIEYWMVGWCNSVNTFFFFWFVFFLYVSSCTFIGQWMSTLMPNAKVANVAVGALSCLFNLFGGFLLPYIKMKWGYKWMIWIMPSSYALNALVGTEVANCDENGFGDGCGWLASENSTVRTFIETKYGFMADERYTSAAVLIFEWFILQVAIFLTLKYVTHLKR